MEYNKRILVLGNGFDLDLGLNTTYKAFAESECFKKLSHYAKGDNLIADLIKQSSTNWFDIEESIADYVKRKEAAKDFTCAEMDQMFFTDFKQIFADFILYEFTNSPYKDNIKKDSLASRIIQEQKDNKIFDKVYSFNCFDYSLNDLVSYGKIGDLYVDYVHNKEGYFILGICEDDCTTKDYSFLIKKNQNYEKTNIIEDLECATDIVIFGHSLNRIDKGYFEDLFKRHFYGKNITIITKDNNSIRDIERNILTMGESLWSLYRENNCNFMIIETKNIQVSNIKVEILFQSLKKCSH